MLGDGMIDFEPMFRVLENADYEDWIVVEVEQNLAQADYLEYAIKARQYIKQKAGL